MRELDISTVPLAAGFAELLLDLSTALTALHTPWYVVGAQAALIWGRPRLNRTGNLGGRVC